MAIKMIRKPSETPNIKNVDDFIPFRYAYGNQSGYVIGKGTELSHSINGNSFKINSGRIVLQGVESDIDANGVTKTLDIVSEKRYYSVYYKVNLATNETSIDIIFDTAGYPEVIAGDDLTTNATGTANLELYRFVTNGGVISEVQKVVKAIDYYSFNARKINNVEIKKNENGVLLADNEIIERKKLIFSSDDDSMWGQFTDPSSISYDMPTEMVLGGTYEVRLNRFNQVSRIQTKKDLNTYKIYINYQFYQSKVFTILFGEYQFDFSTRKITVPYKQFLRLPSNESLSAYLPKLYKIYKIIE